ncbi:MAG: hypothetical protein A2075_18470 [Geobacteraceae bacterium GWC2_58_44]|nr:MAG: hypothetical protein A2075_18470 [Geobacteraceae bacterium GWC2_58_44]HBG06622.1 hypothetical protein [Geobacter sp.]
MRLGTVYISVLLALALAAQAHAAKNVEVIRYPTLFMFGGVSQSLGVSASYAQHETPNSSSSASGLRESYSFGTVAAILNPHLVNMQILGGISYSQHFDDKTSTLLDGEYNILASAFDMSYHPLTISSSRTTTVISNGYTPSYTLTGNNNQISMSLLNKTVPVKLMYVHTTSDTDGLPKDASSVSDAAALALHHEFKDVSDTRFSLTHGRTRSGESESSSYMVSLGNYLTLDRQKRYRLSSTLDVFDTKSGNAPQRNINFAEELACAFGRALTGNFSERFSYSRTLDFENREQTIKANTVSGSISHTLYQSLTTSISASAGQGSVLGGSTSSYVATGRINYAKILPAQSNLTFSLDGSRNIASQHIAGAELAARDEQHLDVTDRIVPQLAGRLVSVISIESFTLDPQGNVLRGERYDEDVDFRVDTVLGQIEILFEGRIVPGSDLLISYTVATNPSIRYQTDALGAATNLSLFSGRYTLSGSLSTQEQKLLSGEATNQTLVSSTNLNLRGVANYNPTQFGIEYGMLDSTQEHSSHIGAYGSHSLHTENNAVIALTLRDTYSMIESTGEGSTSSSQNTLSLAASYSRKLYRWINLTLSLAASDSRSGDRYSDYLSFRGVLNGIYNQLQLSLNGQTLYRITGSGTTRDTNLTCSVTRYF